MDAPVDPKHCDWFETDDAELCEKCKNYDHYDIVEVVCEDGKVRGRTMQSCYGPTFICFHGLPYAKPPIGPLRFMAPQPFGPWNETINATEPVKVPYSYRVDTSTVIGTEDCLNVTIYTKNINSKKPLPVMFWIGGFGWLLDIKQYLGPGYLTDEDVVLVFCSYRLSVFGFLSIGEATAPGNCGLKDVVLGLKWVRRNITAFGGDPQNVTIFGTGSGASMAHYMMLSPSANGLFHKAIIQSGSALHNWALSHHPVEATMLLAKEVGFDTVDPGEAVDLIRTLPATDIMNAYHRLVQRQCKREGFYKLDSIFKPCVEVEFEGQPSFLTKNPYYLIKNGKFYKVPMIIGSSKNESLILETFLPDGVFHEMDATMSNLLPKELGLQEQSRGMKNIGLRVVQFYMNGEKISENMSGYFNFLSDYYFIYYVHKCVKTHCSQLKGTPLYYYILHTAAEFKLTEDLKSCGDTCHGSELFYLFQTYGCVNYRGTSETHRTRRKIVKLWTNFAKYGNPTPDDSDDLFQIAWDPVNDPDRINYLSIGPDLTKGRNPFHERMAFWDSVLDDTNFSRIAVLFDRYTNNY